MRAGLLLLAACGSVHFTDPNAPQLFRSKAHYTTGAAPEPVVWLPVIDVFAERSADCNAARAWTLQIIRSAMLAADPAGTELAGADLSPACIQAPDRKLDATSLRQQILALVASRPSAHVRVAVVYANNIALRVPGPLVDGIDTLRQTGPLWTLARPEVSSQLTPDKAVDWTYTYDVALQKKVADVATAELPLQSDTGIDSGWLPILGAADLPRARAAKFCTGSAGVSLSGLASNGSSSPVVASQPPLFRALFDQRFAVPKSQFSTRSVEVEVEGCSANCNRFFSGSPGELRRWDTTPGCLLGTP